MNEAAQNQPPFAQFLGMKITHVSPERVTAELPVREELNNRHGIMHGGAIMALADNLGGTATTANLKDGQTTTTIESKTNFFAAMPIGDIAYAECTPLHRGRTTMVWQTRVTRGDGRLCALVTQTQMVLEPKSKSSPSPARMRRAAIDQHDAGGAHHHAGDRERVELLAEQTGRPTAPSPPAPDRTGWQSRSPPSGGSANTSARPPRSTAPAPARRWRRPVRRSSG